MNTTKNLPEWLHKYIFEYLGAEEKPDPKEFCRNLHSDDAKNKIYLGTYFPRSFAESYCIHENLFRYESYADIIRGKESLSILSVGCGTGGDILGLLCAIDECCPSIRQLDVVAFDGNHIAIDYLNDLLNLEPIKHRFTITEHYVPLSVTSKDDILHDISQMGDSYDLILSFKCINELMEAKILNKDAFKDIAEILCPKLNETGLFTLLDVTDKHCGEWQSKNLNSGLGSFHRSNIGYKSLLPVPCHFYSHKCAGGRCFTNKKFCGTFTSDDKVVYRVIGRTTFVDRMFPSMKDGISYVKNVDMELCPGFRGKPLVDGFDINS